MGASARDEVRMAARSMKLATCATGDPKHKHHLCDGDVPHPTWARLHASNNVRTSPSSKHSQLHSPAAAALPHQRSLSHPVRLAVLPAAPLPQGGSSPRCAVAVHSRLHTCGLLARPPSSLPRPLADIASLPSHM
mmetsp:Transcript_16017/g.27587  ORF Transcript_16017/g.27587 Transcript_16017/m.27587 type:complete len:135 (-) Transcript_16017:527-931(-)